MIDLFSAFAHFSKQLI